MMRKLIAAVAAVAFPVSGLALTLCEHGGSEGGVPLGFGVIELIWDYGQNEAPSSPEGETWDRSRGGCPNYLNITGYMGRYTSSPYITIDFYSVNEKQYKLSPTGLCQQLDIDTVAPPIIDAAAKTAAGMWISCVNFASPAAPNPPPPPDLNPEPRNTKPSPPPLSCKRGESSTPHPVFLATGEKYLEKVDWEDHSPHPLTLKRFYYTGFLNQKQNAWRSWIHNFDQRLSVIGRDSIEPNYVYIKTGNTKELFFIKSNGAWKNTNGTDKLLRNSEGRWQRIDSNTDDLYIYDNSGQLQKQISKNGWEYVYEYDNQGLISSIKNAFGRKISFVYGSGTSSVLLDGNTLVTYEIDGDALGSAIYPDGSGEIYSYNDRNLLTTVNNTYGSILDSFSYDSEKRVKSTTKPSGIEKYTITYNDDRSVTVKNPIGHDQLYKFLRKNGDAQLASLSQPAVELDQKIAARSFDELGFILSETDFRGTNTAYTWDTARGLPLGSTQAVGSLESRTTQTVWHPLWRLPVSITETGRVTSYTYDNLGNPLTRTITDSNGGADSSGSARTTSWTYHANGLVATETAPNGATTSYQYDSAGNLTSAANALGHVNTYTHDGAGRVLTHTAPNGRVSAYTYDSRGRMLTANRGGMVTTLTYGQSGQVVTASLPDGLVVTYTYDAAQRLSGWSDNQGNSGAYTLDAMGNLTLEDIRNPQGQTVWRFARSINSINRVQTASQGSLTASYSYDSNGDLVATANGQGQGTSQSLDALRRTKAITNAENATASLAYNALDAVTQAKDFKGVATTYTRDALGNATSEASPDAGTEAAQYDALGLPKTVTDALGQATTIERDLLGRPTLITYSDGRTTTLRYDLTSASMGYLGEIVDASGTTTYQRDSHGRVTTKTQTLINGDTRSVSYSYNAKGLLASTTYPGGQALQYIYDTTGQLTGLTWAGQSLVSGITWNPLGQPTGWSWNLPGGSTAIPATRSYNTAGQLTATEFSSYQYDAAGRINGITQNLWQPASTNPQDSSIEQASQTWTVQYSPAGRITGFTKTTAANTQADSASFQYDANGNRTASTRSVAGTSTSRTYSGNASQNRLQGFSQITTAGSNSASTSVTYQYNIAGDLLGDGLTTYLYDSEGRLESASTGQGIDAPTTKYAHNGLGQRVFKTEPLFSSAKQGGGKNLNNLLADDDDESQQQPGFIEQLRNFWNKLWSPGTSDAEKLGWSYVYAEDGSLLGEYGSGGNLSSGTAQYLYLPTASGPMPIAAVIKGQTYAIHSDHLNTPRKLTQADGQAAWQWAYSAFGDEQPTTAANRFTNETTTPTTGSTSIPEVTFNLRYPGQYFDQETKLHYNYFRSFRPADGSYTQSDPIGLEGGWNRFAYVGGNPLSFTDPMGLQAMPVLPAIPIPGVPNPTLNAQRNLADRLYRAFRDDDETTYQTYTRYNPLTGECYSGRTSGTDTPENNVRNRGYGQPLLNAEGFLPPVLDRSSRNYSAIRGREQQLIDVNGGARSSGGTSRNMINGISPINPRGPFVYIPAATAEFGMPVPAGKCTCQ